MGVMRPWQTVRFDWHKAEQLSEPRAERAVEDCAADLQQEIGTASRPSHLL
jgi:hypothetical protein